MRMFTNQTNSLYSSPFASTNALYSNPAMAKYTTPTIDQQSLADAYNKLEALRNNLQTQAPQQPQKATVFTDISKELSDLSEDEKNFIMSSREYQVADAKYQSEFSQFLITKFSDEFLQTNQRTMEELLLAIRNKKEQYKNKFADDVAEIRKNNKSLEDKNNELLKSNLELQKQLEEIQHKLGSSL